MFQSTHLREVRLVRELRQFGRHGFNPRTYERCDNADTRLQQVVKRFNPRTYERCDKVSKNTFDWSHAFQSTHLREVRPKGIDQATLSRSFNPRTYERCDIKLLFTFVSVQFQSTHLREVRPQDNPVCQSIDKFQSTHLREVRHMRYVDLLDENGFNPRTYERCDKAWPSTGASS